MSELLQIVKAWPNAFGQGLFLLIVTGMLLYTVNYFSYCLTCLCQRREPKPPVHGGCR